MTIALIGPSGAGKGTQAVRLMNRFNMLHISTGDLFRESLEKRSALGILARRYMNQGELVPDEVVEAMMEEWLWKVMPGKRILFDGFPRTRYQAEALDDLFRVTDRHLEAAIYLKVPDEEIIRRLPGRVICRTCQTPYHLKFKPPAVRGTCDLCRGRLYQREDDKPDIIRERLKASHRVIDPLVNYYQETGKLIVIDGQGKIEQVYQALVTAIEDIEQRRAQPPTVKEMKEIRALKDLPVALDSHETHRPTLDMVLVGGPGSGKGTQAQQLRNLLDVPHIATGDLFRDNIKNETDLGKLAKTYMNRGELVPDDVTEAMVKERLAEPDAQHGFIMDGFPRTLPQAEALTQILTGLGRRLCCVLHIKVSDDTIVTRLSGRQICRTCQTPYHLTFNPPAKAGVCDHCQGELYQRDDDNPETIRARLKTYHAQTEPLISYYEEAGLLVEIDGQGEVTEITDRVKLAINGLTESHAIELDQNKNVVSLAKAALA
ncbi:MAG: adenylate kinase [Anaerolineae bacterium]|nr:adenylate kinase [Anaerolineae bacterium]